MARPRATRCRCPPLSWLGLRPNRPSIWSSLARDNSPREARDVYLRVLHDFPDDPAAPRALYGLGRLRVDPKSSLRDYAAARLDFGRLVARYPTSAWAPEARAWHAALSELLKHEADAERTRGDLEQLKELDKEMEER